jgi:hypothetical protein
MLDVFGFPSPQQSNYQEFYGGGSTRDWVKPRGASMVRFMLIGAGGGGEKADTGSGVGGGGSGAVTSWIGPAIFIPDVLRIAIGKGGTFGVNGTASTVIYQAKDGTGYTLLTANGGFCGTVGSFTGGAGALASTNNYFGAAGIFSSVAGQNGSDGGSTSSTGDNVTASSTTFLSGGAGGSGGLGGTGGSVTPNYGYLALPTTPSGGLVVGANGYFITQPILVGCGGAGGSTSTILGSSGGKGGIGCGGGGSGEDQTTTSGFGGDGAVFVWAW